MNILYIHTHDTGRYIEPYGYHIPTPNLMRLAREGTIFRQAFCTAPTCSPSRAGLLTGMAPHSCGMIGLAHRGFQLNDYHKHIVSFLNSRGFETVLSGIQHEAPKVEMIGYQKIISGKIDNSKESNPNHASRDLANARAAADYLKEKKEKPFFLSFGMVNTHREYPEIANDIHPNYVMPPSPMHDNPRTRKDMAAFMTSAQTADQCFGMVWDALKESGQEENTLILYTTDHGIAFPNMKCNLYDTGIGVSLILKFSGNPAKGQAVDALVSHLDIFPTICDMLDIEKPSWLQGNSIMPIMEGRVDKIRDEIFSEVTYHAAYEPMRCVRTERYKLIRMYDDYDGIVPANIDDSLSKDFLVDHQYLDAVREKEMLFDLYLDPMERVNVIRHPRYQQVYEDLAGRLENWMGETDDPLLHGKVEKPEGAVVNRRNCLSPRMEDYEE